VLIHTDDCDACGEDDQILEQIFSKLNQIWSIKIVDPEYMLGITRKITYIDDQYTCVESIECTMSAFIQSIADSFDTHLINAAVNTPYPEKLHLSKHDDTCATESAAIIARGYQRAVGMLLWAARHCFPECKYGVSQLCSVMGKPSEAAFKAAMHMCTYLWQHKHRGILFSLKGNHLPIALSDASNKPDRFDGLCHSGFVILWLGGPVSFASKKLKHIGLSSEHNEYMALTFATKRVIWLRQLIVELGICPEVAGSPTLLLGDNTQANRLCKEHFISTGNQYIYLPYHFNKEAEELGHIAVHWLHTKFNVSDLFTKPVPRQVLEALIGGLTGYSPEYISTILQQLK